MKSLLQTFGAEVIELNTAPTGHFAHEPEPIPQHLGQLCASVKQHNADLGTSQITHQALLNDVRLGIAVDPDVDRCVLIDETGTPIG
jgi:phosphomannomutase